ncbi:MAG: D-alanyl-D-alanine carboxypeptidase/D-alanyl-D-alanine-endopeptidase [Candidatus Eremiobacteraeota bacterium]|nr:D-alanyl-D-alanine carboxypeptidase/D-alanyl-D-alanine-endopeptidase [Candidatus Eremiobacteraeota bacterium]
MNIKKSLLLILVFSIFWACSADACDIPTPRQRFQNKLNSIISSSPEVYNSQLGVYVRLVKTNEDLYRRNPDMPLIPASNLKIFISATAIESLGPDYSYITALYGPPPGDDPEVIDGNLYLWSNGDPSLTENDLENFAIQLKQMGIKHVKGDVVGDDSYFDRNHTGVGWKNRYLSIEYAAQCSSLSLCKNIITLKIKPNKTRFTPRCSIIKIKNNTIPARYSAVSVKRVPGTNDIVLNGKVGWHDTLVDTVTVDNPALFTIFTFARILKENGITIGGRTRLISPGEEGAIYAKSRYTIHSSPPLKTILKEINKESDNFYSQQVFKSLGARFKGKGTMENSAAFISEFLDSKGIDTTTLRIVDGCGLSEMNRCTPRQLVDLLISMFNSSYRQEFMDSLPTGGEGTLEYRLFNLPVRAKTGSLRGHSTLSGYVITAAGQTLAFSIMVNHHKCSTYEIQRFQDRLVKALANWKELL